VVGHPAVHQGDTNYHYQAHRVAHDIWAYPVVTYYMGRQCQHGHRLAWYNHSSLGHVDDTVEVMAPLGLQLWPSAHAQRVVEDDLRSHQGTSRSSGGTTRVAMWSDYSLQRCGGLTTIVRAPPLARHVVYLALDGIHWWSSLVRRNL
jgi:hypothetical protein